MWCVLEGSDGAGKTTLADEICRQLEAEGIVVRRTHLGPPAAPETALDENLGGVFAEYTSSKTYVSDRWSWGCPVYGPIYRPESDVGGWGEIGLGGFRYAELFGMSRGTVMVYVDVDPGVARARLEERGDDYVKLEDLERIRNTYVEQVVQNSALPIFWIKRFEPLHNLTQNAQQIIRTAQRYARRVEHLDAYPQYVGPISPARLLTGTREQAIGWLGRDDVHDTWRTTGFVDTSKLSEEELAGLLRELGTPDTEGL